MNLLTVNGKQYKYESVWKNKNNGLVIDDNKKSFPVPKKRKKWSGKEVFLDQLKRIEKYLRLQNKYFPYEPKNYRNCLLDSKLRVAKGLFSVNKIRWEDSLYHYVDKHNIKPSTKFIDFIMSFQYPSKDSRQVLGRINGVEFIKNNMRYVKILRNDLMVMDALMIHGGYNKKYKDEEMNVMRYSEHAGLLDFKNDGLEKFIIMGKKHIAENDNEIYLSEIRLDALDYEYVFHTHPPTPKPGGRVKENILYDIPSFSDVLVFIRHYNKGTTQGSIVVTSEGLYIIRPAEIGIEKIAKTNKDNMLQEWRDVFREGQSDAIHKYGIAFSEEHFYSVISQDIEFINKMNDFLKNYGIYIDYYPRMKDDHNNWILPSIYLPVQVVEPDL